MSYTQHISYELFHEIAKDLCEPIDKDLTPAVRYELYTSKITYLRNIYNQILREINLNKESIYTPQDLERLQQAINITNDFLRETILESLRNALELRNRT